MVIKTGNILQNRGKYEKQVYILWFSAVFFRNSFAGVFTSRWRSFPHFQQMAVENGLIPRWKEKMTNITICTIVKSRFLLIQIAYNFDFIQKV